MKYNLVTKDDYMKVWHLYMYVKYFEWCDTPSLQLLGNAGFSDITSTDRTAQLVQYISEDLQKAEENKDDFLKVRMSPNIELSSFNTSGFQ